jgi:hypothetical protein
LILGSNRGGVETAGGGGEKEEGGGGGGGRTLFGECAKLKAASFLVFS